MLGYYAYGQNVFAPVMPFLRDELDISFAVGGLHVSAFALGMLGAGVAGETIVSRVGLKRVFWLGGGGMALGMGLFVAAPLVQLTITAAFVMGFLGTLLLNVINGSLADVHGQQRGIALMEANIVAYIAATALPLLVGGFEQIGIGWRGALVIAMVGWIVAAVLASSVPFPATDVTPRHTPQSSSQGLPTAFWLFWWMLFFGVSIEWCLSLWSADFMHTVLGLPKTVASTLVAVFIGAGVVGRIVGSRLTHRYDTVPLLLSSLALIAVGFPLFWLVRYTPLNVLGLAICGYGAANLFPLGLAAANGVVAGQTQRASARVSAAVGLAILINPQLLALVADSFGLARAFSIVVVLLILSVVAVGAGYMQKRLAGIEQAL